MAAAGVGWTVGREGTAAFGEPLAGRRYPKPAVPVNGLDDAGRLLPRVTAADAGDPAAGDAHVMVYSFRLCLTDDPGNRVPFPAPARYDPARFEVVRRYYRHDPNAGVPWDLYPLPGKKYDANNGIGKQFSMGLVGGGNGWSEAGPAGRATIWEAHKQYTLEAYRFLTTDEAVPPAVRQRMAALGLCRDEFAGTGHWSPQLYVREGRRMTGQYVLRQSDVQRDRAKPDPVAISSFPIDSHDCRRIGSAGSVVNEGTIFPVRVPGRRTGYPYHVPYRAIVPPAGECDNLLVPVALSATHVAYASVRVEPTWMATGQSAGVAAALAARRDVGVQALPYPLLRDRLLAQGQVLDLAAAGDAAEPSTRPAAGGVDPAGLPGIVLDDARAELAGGWARSANFKPHVGAGYVHDDRRGDGRSTATFRLSVPKSGRYELRLAYSAHPSRAARVPVTVVSGGQTVELTIDQTRPPAAGGPFGKVGEVELAGGDGRETVVTVRNAGTTGFVIVDAVQVVPVGP